MKYIDYLKDNIISIIIYLITISLLFFMLNVFKLNISANILTLVILLIMGITISIINHFWFIILFKNMK